jgi:hypothetical protein
VNGGHRGDLAGVQGGQPIDVRRGAYRRGDDGPRAGHDVDVDPGREQRHDDVAEQDRRVHPVPADRLHRDLARELGRQAGGEHAGVGPQRPVLGQRPPRLAHEPHRHVRRASTAGGDEEGGITQLAARPGHGRYDRGG